MNPKPAAHRAAPHAFVPRLLPLALAAALVVALPSAGHAQGAGAEQAARFEVTIAAQPLARALAELARQTGTTLTVAPALVDGKNAPAVQGALTARQAYERLLAGSGLAAAIDGTAVVIRESAAPPTASAPALPEVRVRAQAEPIPGEPSAPFAGGARARGGRVGLLGDLSLLDAPLATSNFTSQLIENQQARKLSEVLANDASVVVQTASNGLFNNVQIRGFAVEGSQFKTNGLDAQSYQYGTGSVVAVERVEIYKGPTSLLDGNSAVGGSVNIVLKRAGVQPLTALTAIHEGQSRFGAHLDVGRRFGTDKVFGVRINAYALRGDTPVDDFAKNEHTLAAAFDYRGDTLRLTLDLNDERQRYDGGGDLNVFPLETVTRIPAPPDARRAVLQPWVATVARQRSAAVRAEWDATNALTAHVAAARGLNRYRQVNSYAVLLDEAGSIEEGFNAGNGRLSSDAIEAGLAWKVATGPVGHRIVASAKRTSFHGGNFYRFDEVSPLQSNLYEPVFIERPTLQPFKTDFPRGYDGHERSLALADTMSLLSERLRLTVGLRRVSSGSTSYDETGAFSSSRSEPGVTTPGFAVVFKPRAEVSIYANALEAIQGRRIAPDDAANAGQPFPPVRVKQKEVGAKADFGTVGAAFALFDITQPTFRYDRVTRIYDASGLQRNRGVEASVFGEPRKGLRLNASLMALNAKLERTDAGTFDGKRAPSTPRLNVSLGGEWDVATWPGLTLTLNGTRQTETFIDSANLQRLPGYTRAAAGLRYTAGGPQPWVLRAGVDNLFDKTHWIADGYGSFYRSNPRTLRLSATVLF